MILESKDYFFKDHNKKYKINLVKDKKETAYMIDYFNSFRKLNSKNKFVGLDFEFNASPEGKQIALFQINLESENENAEIFLFYPPSLDKNQTKDLKKMLIEPGIKKILHGAESLDIPYLFKNIFTTTKERTEFCTNLFDTRYMCEFMHLEKKLNNKCKIYSILLELKVINKKQYDMLLKNEEDMGPIYEIIIDVNNLDKHTMLYSAFDVLYLPVLLNKFPDNKIYMKLIPEMTCFNFIDRYENFFTKPFAQVLNKSNNYFVITNTKINLKLIDIFNYFYYTRSGIILHFMEINYYKKFLETFIKFIIYKNIGKIYNVYQKSNVLANNMIEFNELEVEFSKIKLFNEFELFFTNLRKELKQEINFL